MALVVPPADPRALSIRPLLTALPFVPSSPLVPAALRRVADRARMLAFGQFLYGKATTMVWESMNAGKLVHQVDWSKVSRRESLVAPLLRAEGRDGTAGGAPRLGGGAGSGELSSSWPSQETTPSGASGATIRADEWPAARVAARGWRRASIPLLGARPRVVLGFLVSALTTRANVLPFSRLVFVPSHAIAPMDDPIHAWRGMTGVRCRVRLHDIQFAEADDDEEEEEEDDDE